MIYLNRKKAAIELSMTTIIVVVLSLTLLILGFVFIRSIMCGAIGVTDEIGKKVDTEVQRLFSTSAGEISCIGSDNIIPVAPGSSVIHCAINAKTQGTYTITFEGITSNSNELDRVNLNDWVRSGSKVTRHTISPGDEIGIKTIRLDIPENAPEGEFIISIGATGPDGHILQGQKQLDFRVSRTGAIKSVLC